MLIFFDGKGKTINSVKADNKVVMDDESFFFDGKLLGDIDKNYIVHKNSFEKIMGNKDVSKIFGAFALVSTRNELFNFATADMSGINEIFYVKDEENLIVSNNFMELAGKLNKLHYDEKEIDFFFRHGYCRGGKTYFKEVFRVPPGRMLCLNHQNKLILTNYLDNFDGLEPNYEIFAKVLRSTINFLHESSPTKKNYVMLSGGVDSTVLSGILSDILDDITALTINYPKLIFKEACEDIIKSKRVCKELEIEHLIVDFDFDEQDLIKYLNRLIFKMPFGTHLGINIFKTIESLGNNNTLWTGMNCDTLYNLGPTSKDALVQRFLISEQYSKMLKGVNGYKKYFLIKKITDSLLRVYGQNLYKSKYTPENVFQLLNYFDESSCYLALSNVKNNHVNENNQDNSLDSQKIKLMLYDQKLGSFFTGGDQKVMINSKSGNEMFFPYSTPNMVHLFRNLKWKWSDIYKPKKFVYQYAYNELNIPKDIFSVKDKNPDCLIITEWYKRILKTSFGEDLLNEINISSDIIKNPFSYYIRLYWIHKVNELLKYKLSTEVIGFNP